MLDNKSKPFNNEQQFKKNHKDLDQKFMLCLHTLKVQSSFFYILYLMGNIVEKISDHKTELVLLGGIAASFYHLNKERREKEELRALLKTALESKQVGMKDFENALNQVYLKDNVEHQSVRNSSEHPIYKIAITGGPCGGKSTSLRRIHEDLSAKGFRVLSVPEIPTLVVQAGGMIMMSKFNIQERIRFQSLLIRFQMYAEDYFTRLAEMSQSPAIVLCDRGTADPAAYVSKEQFQAIMDEQGWSWVTLRDRRYDRVLFLCSTANGAQEFYSLENNQARHESIEVARNLDKRTLNAWIGHPHITVCSNVKGESFEGKVQRAIEAVHKTVGLQVKINRYEKFLVEEPHFPHELKVEISDIEEIFLEKDQKWSEDKLKKRGQNNSYTYQRKYRGKQNSDGDYVQEIRKPLTSLQYVMLREEKADKSYRVINRQRYHFVYNEHPYNIDVYNNLYGREKTFILRFANPKKEDSKALFPDFLIPIEDVRLDQRYSLKAIAKI